MDSPEINAKINQARAGKQMAQSQLDKAEDSARPQEIAQAMVITTLLPKRALAHPERWEAR